MREPLFTRHNQAALRHSQAGTPEGHRMAREAAALHRAITLGIESAFRFGSGHPDKVDLPVGAVALAGNTIIGRGFASDRRLGHRGLHAEAMALIDSTTDVMGEKPDTLVVSVEPCDDCQNMLARRRIPRIVFGLSRDDIASKGLVKQHPQSIFDRQPEIGLGEVAQVQDDALRTIGLVLLDNVQRNPITEVVTIDSLGLSEALAAHNAASTL